MAQMLQCFRLIYKSAICARFEDLPMRPPHGEGLWTRAAGFWTAAGSRLGRARRLGNVSPENRPSGRFPIKASLTYNDGLAVSVAQTPIPGVSDEHHIARQWRGP